MISMFIFIFAQVQPEVVPQVQPEVDAGVDASALLGVINEMEMRIGRREAEFEEELVKVS